MPPYQALHPLNPPHSTHSTLSVTASLHCTWPEAQARRDSLIPTRKPCTNKMQKPHYFHGQPALYLIEQRGCARARASECLVLCMLWRAHSRAVGTAARVRLRKLDGELVLYGLASGAVEVVQLVRVDAHVVELVELDRRGLEIPRRRVGDVDKLGVPAEDGGCVSGDCSKGGLPPALWSPLPAVNAVRVVRVVRLGMPVAPAWFLGAVHECKGAMGRGSPGIVPWAGGGRMRQNDVHERVCGVDDTDGAVRVGRVVDGVPVPTLACIRVIQ